jgi:hypothetical protein
VPPVESAPRPLDQHDIRILLHSIEHDLAPVAGNVECAHSGWHSHPGPVFITVVSGMMTFYDSDDPACQPIVRTAGQGFLDTGDHAHIARNESGAPAVNVVTYFAPPGAALRIDKPAPRHCPF